MHCELLLLPLIVSQNDSHSSSLELARPTSPPAILSMAHWHAKPLSCRVGPGLALLHSDGWQLATRDRGSGVVGTGLGRCHRGGAHRRRRGPRRGRHRFRRRGGRFQIQTMATLPHHSRRSRSVRGAASVEADARHSMGGAVTSLERAASVCWNFSFTFALFTACPWNARLRGRETVENNVQRNNSVWLWLWDPLVLVPSLCDFALLLQCDRLT